MANVVTNTGKGILVNRTLGSGTEPKYIGVGTGAGTAAATDTTLFTESGSTRVTGTSSAVTVTTTDDTYQVTGTYTASGTIGITNAGLWDNATVSSGSLFAKSDFSTVNLSSGDSIAFTFKVTVA